MLACSLARLSRNSDIVYLPSLGTLEDAFATLEKQVLIIQLARRFGMAELLEASKGKGDEKSSEEFHRLSRLSYETTMERR